MVDYYIVERIIAKKISSGKVFYLIKWKNYSEEEMTWEPIENLNNVNHLINEFEEGYNKKYRDGNILEDIPIKITKVKYGDILKKEIKLLVRWYSRNSENISLNPSWVDINDLKNTHPRILCEFLIKNLKYDKINKEI